MKRYWFVVEKTCMGYSAYCPDVDGVVATGRTKEEVEGNMREAIQFHLAGLRLEGLEVPAPRTYPAYVEPPA